METSAIAKIIEHVSSLIVGREFETLIVEDRIKDYSAQDIIDALNNYPETLHLPSDSSKYFEFRFYPLEVNLLQIEFELWANQQPSDLTVILEINDEGDELNYHLKDLRVM